LVKIDELKEKWEITALQLRCWELRESGLTYSEIRGKTGVDASNISRLIRRFQTNYEKIREIVERLGSKPLHKFEPSKLKIQAARMATRMEKAKQGHFTPSVAPYGYRKSLGRLVEVPQQLEKVLQVFESLDKGKSFWQTGRATGLTRHNVRRISRNPIYKGFIRWKGEEYKATDQFKAIVIPELWDRVQKRKTKQPWAARKVPVGYRYEEGKIIIDPEKGDAVRRMFKLRLAGKPFREIDRILGFTKTSVRAIKNPFYAAKKRQNDKWVDLDHEPIVDFDLWLQVQRVCTRSYATMVEGARQTYEANRNKILVQLISGDKTVTQLAKVTGLTNKGIRNHLQRLKGDGFVVVLTGGLTPLWSFKGPPERTHAT